MTGSSGDEQSGEVQPQIESIGAAATIAPSDPSTPNALVRQAAADLRNPAAALLWAGAATILLSACVVTWTAITMTRIYSTPAEDRVAKQGNVTYTYHPSPWRPYLPWCWALLVTQVAAVGAGTIMVLGAVAMPRLQFRRLAVTASVLAMLPLSPAFPISLGLGYMALLALKRPPTRQAFAQAAIGPAAPTNDQVTSLRRGFTKLSGASIGLAVLGVAAGFVPWAHANLFGIQFTEVGMDIWYGWLTTGLMAGVALAVLAMSLFDWSVRLRGLVVALAAAGAAWGVGSLLHSFVRGPQVTVTGQSVTGDASPGLVDSLRSLATSWVSGMVSEAVGWGVWATAACCAALLLLGLWQLAFAGQRKTLAVDVPAIAQ